jgi:hypothetical protein
MEGNPFANLVSVLHSVNTWSFRQVLMRIRKFKTQRKLSKFFVIDINMLETKRYIFGEFNELQFVVFLQLKFCSLNCGHKRKYFSSHHLCDFRFLATWVHTQLNGSNKCQPMNSTCCNLSKRIGILSKVITRSLIFVLFSAEWWSAEFKGDWGVFQRYGSLVCSIQVL